MKKARIAAIAAAAGVAVAVPFLAAAQGAPGGDAPGLRAGGFHYHYAHARHGGFGEWATMGGAFLRGLDLTDAQRDRIFAVRHANEPAMREQGKILHATRAELSKLALSNDYDEAKAKALTDRSAQAMSTMAQLRARGMNEIFRVLTPEQQAKVIERQARWEQRGQRGPRFFGPGGEGRRGAPAPAGAAGAARS